MAGTAIVDEVVVIDRELALALMAETPNEAQRMCARQTDGRILDRYAQEAAIELLSRPAKVLDYLPALARR
jgi:hypothetical protein